MGEVPARLQCTLGLATGQLLQAHWTGQLTTVCMPGSQRAALSIRVVCKRCVKGVVPGL
jgi:hypothetical protein